MSDTREYLAAQVRAYARMILPLPVANPFAWVDELTDKEKAHAQCKNGILCDHSHGCRVTNASGSFLKLHAKCQAGSNCSGPGCRRRRPNRYIPRKLSKLATVAVA